MSDLLDDFKTEHRRLVALRDERYILLTWLGANSAGGPDDPVGEMHWLREHDKLRAISLKIDQIEINLTTLRASARWRVDHIALLLYAERTRGHRDLSDADVEEMLMEQAYLMGWCLKS